MGNKEIICGIVKELGEYTICFCYKFFYLSEKFVFIHRDFPIFTMPNAFSLDNCYTNHCCLLLFFHIQLQTE